MKTSNMICIAIEEGGIYPVVEALDRNRTFPILLMQGPVGIPNIVGIFVSTLYETAYIEVYPICDV
jgi:hypothetical protein